MSLKEMLRKLTIATSVAALATAAMPNAFALTVRDDVGVDGSEELADDTQWDGVVQIYMQNNISGGVNFNCSGTLINARAVISAAHCFNANPSTVYGTDGQPLTPIIGYGPDTFDALFGWFGAGAPGTSFVLDDRNGLVLSNQVIVHPDADFGGLAFPAGDVALLSLSSPLANLPTYSMLFSPVDVGEHVDMVAYGGHGIGSTGDTGIDGKRQAGENLIGMVGTQNDFLSAVFGLDTSAFFNGAGDNQALYWTDFDNPNRTGDECGRVGIDWICSDAAFGFSFFGGGNPLNVDISLSNDWFDGDALPNESGTAGGDSGSAIFFDQLSDQLLIGGVLSGGFTFTSPVPSGYADISYYNPLFNFYDFIAEANPYKYVSANEGDGNWSDAAHWTQDLDPGYFIIDENGDVVNGLPDSPEPGVTGSTPNEGTVLGIDISPEATTTSAAGQPDSLLASASVSNNFVASGSVFGSGDLTQDFSANQIVGEPEVASLLFGDVDYGVLDGPGSSAFVPNNGLNSSGFFNYFDVTLSNAGTTTVDMDVEVDALAIANMDAVLAVGSDYTFVSLIETEIYGGALVNDGIFASRDILNFGGTLTGTGDYFADTVWNAGLLNAGDGMAIFGDLVLTSMSTFGYSGDTLAIDGDVALGGNLGLGYDYQWSDTGTLFTYTGDVTGEFASTDLAGVLFNSVEISDGQASFTVEAEAFSTELGGITDPVTVALGETFTNLRETRYDDFTSVYSVVDHLTGDVLEDAFLSLVPEEYADFAAAQTDTSGVTVDVAVDLLTLTDDATIASNQYLVALAGTIIDGASVTVNGAHISNGTVNGGWLTGTGAIVGDLTNAGLLEPGAGMEVWGDLTLTSDGMFGYSGNSLTVTGDVALGGSVAYGTSYAFGETGTLINYGGDVSGNLSDTDLAGVLFATYTATDGAVSFEIQAEDFTALLKNVENPNVIGIATALSEIRDSSFDDLGNIYGVIDYLEEPELSTALDSLLPTDLLTNPSMMFTGVEQIQQQVGRRFASIASGTANGYSFNKTGAQGIQVASSDPMAAFALSAEAAATEAAAPSDKKWGTFVELSVLTGDVENGVSGGSSDLSGYSLTVGGDVEIGSQVRVGGFMNYSGSETDLSGGAASSETKGIMGGVYGLIDFGNETRLEAFVGGGDGELETNRIGGFTNQTISGVTDTNTLFASASLSKAMTLTKGIGVEPSLGVEYIDFDIDGYSETGGSSALTFDGQNATSTRARIGTKFHFNYQSETTGLRPSVGINLVHDLDPSDNTLVGQFASGASTSFTTVGGSPDDSWVEAEASLAFVADEHVSLEGYVMHTFEREDVEYTTTGFKLNVKF